MKMTATMAGALALSLLGTGCATKKYVAKTVAPIEQRVTTTEGVDKDQNTKIASQGTAIEGLDRDLSSTKEKLGDTTAKANQAEQDAKTADQHAGTAQTAADGAKTAADGARSFAEQGFTRVDKTMEAMNKFQKSKEVAVLFKLDSDMLSTEGKAELDDLAKQASGMERYVIEVQGFTDKSGNPTYNENLSERRAETVARYLTNNFEIPVRNVSMIGSGYARPVADDKTRDGRKMNRRVEVRLWVPSNEGTKSAANNAGN